jgi:hypothetical protein
VTWRRSVRPSVAVAGVAPGAASFSSSRWRVVVLAEFAALVDGGSGPSSSLQISDGRAGAT